MQMQSPCHEADGRLEEQYCIFLDVKRVNNFLDQAETRMDQLSYVNSTALLNFWSLYYSSGLR